MISDTNVLRVIVTVSAVTMGLRLAPFILMAQLSDNQYFKYIGQRMPVGVMTLLVVYSFIHVDFTIEPYGVPQILSALLVLLVYWYRKNALASIGIGVAVHLTLVNFIF
jgi:branched-subunit amino acid transport protein AzlD